MKDTEIIRIAQEAGKKLKIAVTIEDHVIYFNEWVSMRKDTIEVTKRTLKGKKTTKEQGWIVEVAMPVTSPGEPDDVDIIEDSTSINPIEAIENCLNIVRENDVHELVGQYL
jgi:transcription antitermination factor NusA-like protein